jgi:hypothetical protein
LRLLLILSGVSFIVAGFAALLFPYDVVGLTGIDLPTGAAVIDARASYGGTQIGVGLFLLWCRAEPGTARAGLVLIFLFAGCLLLARLYGFVLEGEIDRFNLAGTIAELMLAAVAGALLHRGGVETPRDVA